METETKSREALAAAAAPTLEDISRLAVTTGPQVSALLFYIRDHLFDPQLTVSRARRACGLRDNSIALRFHRETGTAPGTFITDCRLAVAERLLTGTRIPVWRVADLAGYSSIQVFSRSYCRRKGVRPSSVRRSGPRPSSKPPTAPGLRQPTDLLTRAFAGELGSDEVADLIVRLLRIYPPQVSPLEPTANA